MEGSMLKTEDFHPREFHDINIKTDSNQSTIVQQRHNSNMPVDNSSRDFTGLPSSKTADEDLNTVMEDTRSLSEKLRTHYREGSTAGSKAKTFARGLFQFHMFTFTFMAFVYLLPWALDEYDYSVFFFLYVLFTYIFLMIQSNWVLSIITESDLPTNIPHLPPQSSELDEASLQNLNMKFSRYHDTSENGNRESTCCKEPSDNLSPSSSSSANPPSSFAILPRVDRYGMIWKYCDICQRFRPPRTYHCKFCRKCVLRRDHHCHMIGNCIGHYNQRFFVVLCFYLLLAASVGFPITACYLSSHLQEAQSWTWYILPYTIILFIFRYISWKMLILTIHAYLMFIFGILSLLYWLSQLSLISMGKTLVEVIKQMDVKVSSSLSENFHVVFGNNWFLSFLIPVPSILKQTHNGITFDRVTIYGKKIDDI